MVETKQPTTLEEIEALDRDFLRPADIAKYINSSQNTINQSAKAGNLPWACKNGNRTLIPKRAFIHWCKYGTTTIKQGE